MKVTGLFRDFWSSRSLAQRACVLVFLLANVAYVALGWWGSVLASLGVFVLTLLYFRRWLPWRYRR